MFAFFVSVLIGIAITAIPFGYLATRPKGRCRRNMHPDNSNNLMNETREYFNSRRR